MSQMAEGLGVELRPLGEFLTQSSVVFAAYLLAGKLGQATVNIRSSNLGPVWPAYGVALAAILICGYRVWVAVAGAAFLVAFLSPVPLLAAAGQAAGATLAAIVGAFLLHHLARFHLSLARLRDALALIAIGAFGSTLVSASIGISVLYTTHVHPYSGLAPAWAIYWLGDATGALLVTPLILTFHNLLKIRSLNRVSELVALLVLLTATCFVVYGDLPLISVKLHLLAFVILPFVIWAAIRFGVCGAALTTLAVASIATVETALGSGPFAQHTPFVNAVLLDIFFAVLAVSGLTLAAVIAEREQAEREREQLVRQQAATEARLRLGAIVESSDDAIIGTSMGGIITEWNRGAERLYGYEAQGIIGNSISLLFTSDHSGALVESLEQGTTKRYEAVHQKKDGTRVQVSVTQSPIRDSKNRIVGVSTISRDITERKRAEEALAGMSRRLIAAHAGVSRRLIAAQDQERARIARDLHDDIGQRLAVLSMELEQFRQNFAGLPPEARRRTDELWKRTSEIASDVQGLSHELHSSKLRYLGLGAAVRGFCKEFGEQQKVDVEFFDGDLPSPLSAEISLCLFRVLQEALHNAAKHSGVRHFEVRLWGTADEIHLTVSDTGVGFDRETVKEHLGPGDHQHGGTAKTGGWIISNRFETKAWDDDPCSCASPTRGQIHASHRVRTRSGRALVHCNRKTLQLE